MLKRTLTILFLLFISLNSYCQSSLSYKELKPLFNIVKDYTWEEIKFYKIEDALIEKISELNWDLESNKTFENLFSQTKNAEIDYRYFLLIAKIANSRFRNYKSNDRNLIDFYYKSLFINLAIEQGSNLKPEYKDLLKFEYTRQYILSTLLDSCFPSDEEFKKFAEYNIKYSLECLSSTRLNIRNIERSELYWIIADANYRTKFLEEKNGKNIGEVFRYLTLSIKEDPKNWRAIKDRGACNFEIGNYKSAIDDFLLWLEVTEENNRKAIDDQKKWLLAHSSAEVKKINSMWSDWDLGDLTSPTFTGMENIAESYLRLNDYKNVLIWCDKGLNAIKEYRLYNKNTDELTSEFEGIFYYDKALAHYNLDQEELACNELENAINHGYDIEECQKLQVLFACNENLVSLSSSVPLTKKDGVYEIPVMINSVLKLNFIFDAGASDISIPPDVALTLIGTGTVSDKDFIGTQTYKFADGSTAKSDVFIIKEIQLGNKKVNNVRASIANSINAPLLLGQSVLNKFGKITIDYHKGIILFQN